MPVYYAGLEPGNPPTGHQWVLSTGTDNKMFPIVRIGSSLVPNPSVTQTRTWRGGTNAAAQAAVYTSGGNIILHFTPLTGTAFASQSALQEYFLTLRTNNSSVTLSRTGGTTSTTTTSFQTLGVWNNGTSLSSEINSTGEWQKSNVASGIITVFQTPNSGSTITSTASLQGPLRITIGGTTATFNNFNVNRHSSLFGTNDQFRLSTFSLPSFNTTWPGDITSGTLRIENQITNTVQTPLPDASITGTINAVTLSGNGVSININTASAMRTAFGNSFLTSSAITWTLTSPSVTSSTTASNMLVRRSALQAGDRVMAWDTDRPGGVLGSDKGIWHPHVATNIVRTWRGGDGDSNQTAEYNTVGNGILEISYVPLTGSSFTSQSALQTYLNGITGNVTLSRTGGGLANATITGPITNVTASGHGTGFAVTSTSAMAAAFGTNTLNSASITWTLSVPN